MSKKDITRLASKIEDRMFPKLLKERRKCARAAVRIILAAMREPTETQYDALCRTDKMWREQTSETVWKTYIDALLADG